MDGLDKADDCVVCNKSCFQQQSLNDFTKSDKGFHFESISGHLNQSHHLAWG